MPPNRLARPAPVTAGSLPGRPLSVCAASQAKADASTQSGGTPAVLVLLTLTDGK